MTNPMTRTIETALVTGASSGIGKAIAERLLKEGLTVYVAARSTGKMADLAAKGALPIAMDITDAAQVAAAVAQIRDGHGGVDLLVNNAGFAQYGAVEEVSIDDARYQFEVNLFGLARLTQQLLPLMRARGGGRIVNISSMGGRIYTPLGAWYHATKHALEGWSDCLRLELAPQGIDVVIVEPGIIRTGFGDVVQERMARNAEGGPYAALAARVAEATRASYAAGSGSPPEVIAEAVVRVVRARRPRTRYVAGQYARLLLGARALLSDRMFDRLIMSAMGR